jgi:alkaline phosphatase D
MIAPLLLGHQIINDDQWDDYPAERKKVYDHILQDSIHDVAVLTGDIHSAWANNLRVGGDSGDSVGVEFVTTSITSQGFQGLSFLSPATIQAALPHVKYVELAHHGYYVLDITRAKVQADYYIVDTIGIPTATTSLAASWYENHNERFLRSGTVSAGFANPLPPLAPATVQQTTGIANGTGQQNVVILGAYPNPSNGEFVIQFFLAGNSNVHAQVFDLSGKMIMDRSLTGAAGVNYTKVNLSNFADGDYLLVLTDGQNSYHKLLSKSAQ